MTKTFPATKFQHYLNLTNVHAFFVFIIISLIESKVENFVF